MSDAYAAQNRLVSAESNYYDRGLDVVIATSVVAFAVAMITLIDLVLWTPAARVWASSSACCWPSSSAASASPGSPPGRTSSPSPHGGSVESHWDWSSARSG
ncbi:hypothetical protein ACFQL1_12180 [Halomicroarcula sp. GCM10025709]|uniref:hypothetical protein n=1 Tax=Halomicroarcula sp. GCM10025709 TaxID=3252669 RepID=UPI00360EBEFB